ncbi:hypothetical protein EK904_015109, partial [Melospiza melodia maxima]
NNEILIRRVKRNVIGDFREIVSLTDDIIIKILQMIRAEGGAEDKGTNEMVARDKGAAVPSSHPSKGNSTKCKEAKSSLCPEEGNVKSTLPYISSPMLIPSDGSREKTSAMENERAWLPEAVPGRSTAACVGGGDALLPAPQSISILSTNMKHFLTWSPVIVQGETVRYSVEFQGIPDKTKL